RASTRRGSRGACAPPRLRVLPDPRAVVALLVGLAGLRDARLELAAVAAAAGGLLALRRHGASCSGRDYPARAGREGIPRAGGPPTRARIRARLARNAGIRTIRGSRLALVPA